jgi:hypothetical protein
MRPGVLGVARPGKPPFPPPQWRRRTRDGGCYSSRLNMSHYQLSMHEYHRPLLVFTAGRTRARGVPGIDGELAGTVPVGHAGHGGDDSVEAVYRCLARDGTDEPGPHDRVVHQVLSRFQGAAGGEDRHPRCGAGPTRRAVELAIGEDGHVALVEVSVTGLAELVEQDRPVDPVQPRVSGCCAYLVSLSAPFTSRPMAISSLTLPGSTARPASAARTWA